jgi:hypothetical protein
MDQTPVWYSTDPSTTMERENTRTVNIRGSASATTRVTVAVMISAEGQMMKPTVIFKGKRSRYARIPRELQTLDPYAHYTVQQNAWMDKSVMLEWIEKVNHSEFIPNVKRVSKHGPGAEAITRTSSWIPRRPGASSSRLAQDTHTAKHPKRN